ncbi:MULTISPECIES: 50S ribosomal protein L21 [Anaerococcus]|uniref:Large ribosomal subunit protein bL21 n=1 Tax=Anaerococcus octavius TaxID=54007 RepID=A0A380WTU2_9FIRM|nr:MULTISPECIES: 50S ribosomal protein L21 [Anaerococcus]MDU3176316.1 50S ribosomal protein L21 [Anaerococcus sp.]MDU4025381.1 50S ribosomal protein L21 [Anaerococcus sp.]SUU92263.1 50S ribosomal protein L21 [Anaerococcus octavius]
MYAIIKTGGKQYKVSEGDLVRVEKLPYEVGETVEFDEVLLVANDSDIKVGSPTVANAKVSATIEDQNKDKKIIVYKYKPKKMYRKKQGHRQPYTLVKIDSISAN